MSRISSLCVSVYRITVKIIQFELLNKIEFSDIVEYPHFFYRITIPILIKKR
jgi:hypothetical protein